MRLWEVVLTHERKINLTLPAVYPAWYHSLFARWKPTHVHADGTVDMVQNADGNWEPAEPFPGPLGLLPFAAAWDQPDDALWCPAIRSMWENSIRALRYAARIARKVRTRKPEIDTTAARRVWQSYVGRLILTVPRDGRRFHGYRPIASPGAGVAAQLWGGTRRAATGAGHFARRALPRRVCVTRRRVGDRSLLQWVWPRVAGHDSDRPPEQEIGVPDVRRGEVARESGPGCGPPQVA